METLLQPEERVLSTLNQDGSRRWLKPRTSHGRFWHLRRVVAYSLIAIFTALPFISINDKPAILLDIIHREFTFFGKTLFATDTLLLSLFMMIVFVTIFMLTAIVGRVWCGWACPQTVYLEFVYRPIEKLLDRMTSKAKGMRVVLKALIYVTLSAILAHTFLSYFVGVANLRLWIFHSPLEHPIAFLVVVAVTGLMLFDFGFFREQLCIVACPYGRFQSVMLDRASLIVGYDRKRGEPRGKLKRRKPANDVSLKVLDQSLGDCIDCTLCVQTCPTGIDIRDGLQLECIHCAQCIDACDAVMDKIGKPRGLIRYSSQDGLESNTRRFIRPRIILYPMLLAVLLGAFILVLSSKDEADVGVVRHRGGALFSVLDDGSVVNQARIRITNRTRKSVTYSADVIDAPGVSLSSVPIEIEILPNVMESLQVRIIAEPSFFTSSPRTIQVRVVGSDGFKTIRTFTLHGPIMKEARP
ncbi:MAG: cytochrome c oxidase accessory protein CcoG [Phycisphaeraceae bacterium]|nr:cytochrome c oxidase accessory protein CcoG [Phycisphaeraceae bacterium]MCW5762205.1 cytochrome c oxidase accessory protein CcoG [Phycisphaeraceae bacterium]